MMKLNRWLTIDDVGEIDYSKKRMYGRKNKANPEKAFEEDFSKELNKYLVEECWGNWKSKKLKFSVPFPSTRIIGVFDATQTLRTYEVFYKVKFPFGVWQCVKCNNVQTSRICETPRCSTSRPPFVTFIFSHSTTLCCFVSFVPKNRLGSKKSLSERALVLFLRRKKFPRTFSNSFRPETYPKSIYSQENVSAKKYS